MPRLTLNRVVEMIDARVAELELMRRSQTSTETNRYVYAGTEELKKLRRRIEAARG